MSATVGDLAGGVLRLAEAGLEYRFGRMLCAGVGAAEVRGAAAAARRAWEGFRAIHETGQARGLDEPVLWPRLGRELGGAAAELQPLLAWAEDVRPADSVLSIGIGGSYLGNRVLRDGLLGTRWNELGRAARGGRPRLEFVGYHLDPAELRQLLEVLRARGGQRLELLAISKSGTTTETLASVLALLPALRALPGVTVGFSALTAPGSVLAELAAREGGRVLRFPEGIGGRFSVLSPVGLVTAAASGVPLHRLLAGAEAARRALLAGEGDPSRDPALLFALLHHLHARQGRNQAVFMPYSERLKALSEWYVQLLAESLGKERDRQGQVVHAGRTPIVAVGTTDMHAQTQLHQEGPQDKVVTTVDVADWGPVGVDQVPADPLARGLAGRSIAALNTLAREANEEALAGSGRPSGAWVLDRLEPEPLGALLYILMASVSYEGELLDVCAYDQPGVEAYKKIMKGRL